LGSLLSVDEFLGGDTLVVEINGQQERVRLIGVDTPETVHPQKPVEYFGKEASAFTKQLAEGQAVRLEDAPHCTDRDKYNRLLRYVYLPDGRLLNAEIIAQGYGHAYTRFPFAKMEEFRALEREAREAGRGLWGAGKLAATSR
jgi:micrococcal nuclease